MQQKKIIEEIYKALNIADQLDPETREATFKKLIEEYIKIELPELYGKRRAG